MKPIRAPEPDHDFVKRLLSHVPEALSEFYKRYGGMISQIAWRYHSRGSQYDPLEEAHLASIFVLTGIRPNAGGELKERKCPLQRWLVDPKGSLRGFIAVTVRNFLLDLRRIKHAPVGSAEGADAANETSLNFPSHAAAPDERLYRKERRRVVHQAFDRLSPADQKLLNLRLCYESSFREIADLFGIRESTVKYRYHRAVEKLRTLLEQECGRQIENGF